MNSDQSLSNSFKGENYTGEDFLAVSNRGRMAFFLCCAEQALMHEGKSKPIHPRWQIVIASFWNILSSDDFDEIEDFLTDYLPKHFDFDLETYDNYIAAYADDKDTNLKSEQEFYEMKLIYSSGSKACYFLKFMDIYFNDGIYGAENEPSTVLIIDTFLEYISKNKLSLPPIENFLNCERKGDFNWGETITRDQIFKGI